MAIKAKERMKSLDEVIEFYKKSLGGNLPDKTLDYILDKYLYDKVALFKETGLLAKGPPEDDNTVQVTMTHTDVPVELIDSAKFLMQDMFTLGLILISSSESILKDDSYHVKTEGRVSIPDGKTIKDILLSILEAIATNFSDFLCSGLVDPSNNIRLMIKPKEDGAIDPY